MIIYQAPLCQGRMEASPPHVTQTCRTKDVDSFGVPADKFTLGPTLLSATATAAATHTQFRLWHKRVDRKSSLLLSNTTALE